MKNSIFRILFFSIFIISCSKNQRNTIIDGNIPNLPNGKLYLFEDNGTNKIDSVTTKNGKFKFVYNWNKNSEPVYLGLIHKDNCGVLRFFGYPTNSKYKGSPMDQSSFFSDSIIKINGKIFDNTPINFPKTAKSVNLRTPIIAGKQTEAFYNIDGDLFEKIDNNTAKIVKEKLQKYPYSFHLLYEIDSNKNSFSALQIEDFLKLFKGEITKSETYKKLANYNQRRLNIKNLAIPLLEDSKAIKKEILNESYKKHLLVFWASWCGPCRKEIPILKKMYAKYGNDIEFVSISTDTDKLAWQNALKQENMMWKQLIKSGKPTVDEALQIHFRVNQAIPYTVLVGQDNKVISFSTGLSDEKDLEDLLKK